MITYNDGLKVKGSGYVMDIPDGFVIQNASDRDFIAYKDCPGEYFESDIIIYAAQQISTGEMKLKTVAEFCSMAEAIKSTLPSEFGEVETAWYERKDLPGAIWCFDDCVHVHLSVGIDDHFQQMRIQFNNANRQNKAKYQKMAVEIFDHMRPDKPVELLEELDAEKYISMSDGSKDMSEWIKLVQEYAEHIGIVRNIQQNAISSAFNENPDISQLKKDIRKMLKGISALVDEELIKAEAIYTLKRAKYPNSPSVRKMKAAVKSLIDLASQSASVLGENIAVRSSFASAVNARLDKPVSAVIDTICSEAVLSDSDVKNALLQAKTKAAKAPADKSSNRKPTASQLATVKSMEEIRELLSGGEKLTAAAIRERLDISSTQRTTALLRKLIEDGYLVKTDEVGVTYYMLHKVPDNKQSKKAQGAKAKTAKAPADKSSNRKPTAVQIARVELEEKVRENTYAMLYGGEKLTADEITERLNISSTQRTTALLRKLTKDGSIVKADESGVTYYMLPNAEQEARDWAAKLKSNKEFALSCLERVDKYKKRVDAAVAEREEQIKSEALQKIEPLESKKAACEKKLETLGFFSFSEKRSAKEEIVSLQAEIKTENDALNSALSALKHRGAKAVKAYKHEVDEFLEKRYNLGNKKYMINSSDLEVAFGKYSGSIFIDNRTLWKTISLMRSGEKYLVNDITVLANISSTQRTSALMRKLCEMGYVTKSWEKGYIYYMVYDQDKKEAEAKIYKHLEERLTLAPRLYARYADNPEFSHLQCPEIPKVTI